MTTLQMLMAAGDDLLETRVIPGAPDWEALHGETPDDTLPGEDAAADLVGQMERLSDGGLLDPDTAAEEGQESAGNRPAIPYPAAQIG